MSVVSRASKLNFPCSAPIASSVVWEDIAIKERGPEGQEVDSKILLPIYCSTFVTGVLHGLCAELYSAGCHGYTENEVPNMLGKKWICFDFRSQ